MKKNTDIGLQRFAAAAIEKQWRALTRELPRLARRSRGIEPIHRARVACRRLRTMFDVFRGCIPGRAVKKWRREIRRLGRALGRARDADVMASTLRDALKHASDPDVRPGIRRLMLRQRQGRDDLQADIESAVRRIRRACPPDESAVFTRAADRRKRAETGAPAVADDSLNRARKAAAARLEALLDFAKTARNPKRTKALHRVRIAAKHLRYSLEALAPLLDRDIKPAVAALRKLQDRLGEIHDCGMCLAQIPCFLASERRLMRGHPGRNRHMARIAPGIKAFRRTLRERRAAVFDKLAKLVARLERESLWTRIRTALACRAGERGAGRRRTRERNISA